MLCICSERESIQLVVDYFDVFTWEGRRQAGRTVHRVATITDCKLPARMCIYFMVGTADNGSCKRHCYRAVPVPVAAANIDRSQELLTMHNPMSFPGAHSCTADFKSLHIDTTAASSPLADSDRKFRYQAPVNGSFLHIIFRS